MIMLIIFLLSFLRTFHPMLMNTNLKNTKEYNDLHKVNELEKIKSLNSKIKLINLSDKINSVQNLNKSYDIFSMPNHPYLKYLSNKIEHDFKKNKQNLLEMKDNEVFYFLKDSIRSHIKTFEDLFETLTIKNNLFFQSCNEKLEIVANENQYLTTLTFKSNFLNSIRTLCLKFEVKTILILDIQSKKFLVDIQEILSLEIYEIFLFLKKNYQKEIKTKIDFEEIFKDKTSYILDKTKKISDLYLEKLFNLKENNVHELNSVILEHLDTENILSEDNNRDELLLGLKNYIHDHFFDIYEHTKIGLGLLETDILNIIIALGKFFWNNIEFNEDSNSDNIIEEKHTNKKKDNVLKNKISVSKKYHKMPRSHI